ncbi:carboxypeptidase N subunit 2 [Aplysia californica]|uniref:Carboxypeptidase N subunit 2 n=1 Tax=Aplysia californica TaxID=6500 RepID=A0ABM0JLS3_APLCA|nr:carboxypeptidase N subunit 2 [Aplysia californica]
MLRHDRAATPPLSLPMTRSQSSSVFVLVLCLATSVAAAPECLSVCHCENESQDMSCVGGKVAEITAATGGDLQSLEMDKVMGVQSMDRKCLQDLKDKDLTRLTITFSFVKTLDPGVFDNMTSLEELNLSKNEISSISPEVFTDLSHLRSLNLSHNRLAGLEGTLAAIPTLTSLDLSSNSLQELPSGVFRSLTELTFLKLNGNSLKSLYSHSFEGLSNVREFHARDCDLNFVEKNVLAQMTKLVIVDLGKNLITVLPPPKVLSKVIFLKTLLLDSNKIQSIAKRQFVALHLQTLDLSSNVISDIDEDAFTAMAMQELNLFNNSIVSLSKAVFQPLTHHLTYLNLAGNRLQNLDPTLFQDLQLLVSLNLSSCALDSFGEELLKNLPKLQKLDISRNQLHFLPESMLAKCNQLDVLSLHDNQWVCDCQIEALRDWLQKANSAAKLQCHTTGITQGICLEPTCASPSDLSKVKVSALQDEQLSGCKHEGSSSSLPAGTQGAIVASCMGFAIILLIITIYLWKRGKTSHGLKKICVPSNAESSHTVDEDSKVPPLENCERSSLTLSDHNFVFRHYFDHLVTDPKLMSKTSDSEDEGEEAPSSGKKEKDSLYSSQPSLYSDPVAAYGMESTV